MLFISVSAASVDAAAATVGLDGERWWLSLSQRVWERSVSGKSVLKYEQFQLYYPLMVSSFWSHTLHMAEDPGSGKTNNAGSDWSSQVPSEIITGWWAGSLSRDASLLSFYLPFPRLFYKRRRVWSNRMKESHGIGCVKVGAAFKHMCVFGWNRGCVCGGGGGGERVHVDSKERVIFRSTNQR